MLPFGFDAPESWTPGPIDALLPEALGGGPLAVGWVPMEVMTWLPVWVTPFWVIALGLVAGTLLAAAFYAVLGLLSLVPPLGRLGGNSRSANVTAAVLSVVIAGVLCWLYVPGTETADGTNAESADAFRGMLVLPLVTIGIVLGWGIVYGMWRRTFREMGTILTEGVMPYVLGTAAVVTVVGLAGTALIPERDALLRSIPQVQLVGDSVSEQKFTLPGLAPDVDPDQAPFTHLEGLQYEQATIDELRITTDRTILLADAETPDGFTVPPTRIDPDEPIRYKRGDLRPPPLPSDSRDVYAQNREIDPAVVTFTFVTRPEIAEAATVPITAAAFFLVLVGYITFRQAAPRVAAIALATAKSEMAQPLYLVLLSLGGVTILLFTIVPFNTLGEDIKLLKDSGVTLIMVLGLIQAVWSAGTSVSEEIEGRTALTVLSKPVSRRSFLLGKYAGIMLGVLVLFLVLGTILLLVVSYKPIYDAREMSTEQPGWQVAHEEVVTTIPPLLLYFMETMALGAVAVAVATRLPMLANFVICFMVYVVGNLTAPLVRAAAGDNPLVGFVGNLIAVVIPNLNTFNVQSAVDAGNPVPPIYLAGAFNYLVCFGIMILMFALLLFEDRDLA